MKRINYKVLLYCFIITTIILFFTSKSSPFYPMNDWVDANAFMTVGKSMMKGIVPYKDIFEQKGPILYFIYGLASLISDTSFIGVFVFEIIFMTFTMYFAYLIIKMFLNKKKSLLILPIFLLLITTCKAFTHGSSCEEFMFLPEVITLYYFIKHFKVRKLNYKEYLLIGILAGIILFMKYTTLGLWFAFMMLIFVSFVRKKKAWDGFKCSLMFGLGMLIPTIIVFGYFIINKGLLDFVHVYFVVNITSYSIKISIFKRIIVLFGTFFSTLFKNSVVIILLVLLCPFFIFKLSLKKEVKWYIVILYLFTIIGAFYGLKDYVYYVLPVNFFILLSLIGLMMYIKDKYLKKGYNYILVGVLVISCSLSYFISNNRDFHNVKKDDLFQYQFAEIISSTPNSTMVNMGFLDTGVYLTANKYPSTYYFELQNFDYDNYPDNQDAFKNYIAVKKTTYIVYVKKKLTDKFIEEEKLRENYDIIINEKAFNFENKTYYAYLWRVKE